MTPTSESKQTISYSDWTAADLAKLDFASFARQHEEEFYLRPLLERAQAHSKRWQPLSVEERFQGFKLLGFHPHGYFLPEAKQYRDLIWKEVRRLGWIEDDDERLRAYFEFQNKTMQLERIGLNGRWTGQQEVARSTAQFRLVGCGRRWGKTLYAAYEALGICMVRPRARVWIAAPIMKLVSRCFDEYVEVLVEELGIKTIVNRSSSQEKLIIFENRSAIEGVSLENTLSVAGATVNLAIVDEAAQMLPDAWYRGILPPLASRNGQALLISSYEGEGDFFSDQAEKVKAETAEMEEYRSRLTDTIESAPAVEWQQFNSPTYEGNFFDYPKGREDPKIRLQERNMPPEEFAEQFGATPMGARERVYKEFSEKVHVGNYWFDPNLPVYLSIDPSTGINEYAVAVFQKWTVDGVECPVMVDEFYRVGMTAETVGPILDQRVWRPNVEEAIVDAFAGPDEVIRWLSMKYPAIATPDPGKVDDGIPLVRNMLRHPHRYYAFYRAKVNEVLWEMGLPEDEDLRMLTMETHEIYSKVIEKIAPERLSIEDIEQLRGCARLFISVHCVSAVKEFKMYSYEKKRKQNVNYKEAPRKFKDHLMDCTRNWLWGHYRFELEGIPSLPRSYMGLSSAEYSPEDFGLAPARPMRKTRSPGEGVLGQWRDEFSGGVGYRGVNFMGTGGTQKLIDAPYEPAVA